MRTSITIFFFSFILFSVHAQKEIEIYNHLGLNIKYGLAAPTGTMADRFGIFNEAGIGFEYFFSNSNLFLSGEADFFFGNTVNEDVIEPLRSANGVNILGVDGTYARIFLRMRGSYFGMMMEKLVLTNEYGRGWRIGIGGGIFSHRVRVQDDSNSVPQVQGDYVKGYDHRTVGPAIRERIAYNYVNNARKIFFSAGVEFTQGFTKNIRAINYDSGLPEKDNRLDLTIGFHFKYTLVFKNSNPAETIYY